MKKLLWVLVMVYSFNLIAQVKPVLSNFRVEDSNKDRIYFDASGDISGLTKQGFVISGKTISSINTSGKYFTISIPFTFWDNSTIRLGEVTDTSDKQTILHNFTLEYINNNIAEPLPANEEWYVDASVSISGDGKSQKSAFKTIMEGVRAISQGGAIVHIKAGNYEDEAVKFWNELPPNNFINPFIFEGYKTVPGDLNGVKFYNYVLGGLDATKAPLLDGRSRTSGTGVSLAAGGVTNRDYIIFRNFQVQNFKRGILSNRGSNIVLDNCVSRNIGAGTSDNGIYLYSGSNNRITNCISINASVAAFAVNGDFNLVENCEAYGEDSGGLKMDYYYSMHGHYNIYKNNLSKKILNDGNDWEHGFSLSGDKVGDTEYNLIEDQETTNGPRGVELRRGGCAFNVVRGLYSHDTDLGIQIRDGANNNVVEDSYFFNVAKGIDFSATGEAGDGSAFYNIFKNIVISKAKIVVFHRGNTVSDLPEVKGNKFYNLTIYESPKFWNNYLISPKSSLNEWINCNIVKVKSQGFSTGQTFENSNFFESWQTLVGGSNISIESIFVNETNNDFRLKSNSKLIDKGKNLPNVENDFDGKPRPQGNGTDIGAFEYQDNTTGSIKANAGTDQTICSGGSVTLTASGGSSYSWNTGETTKSITVSPSTNTTYTVTVSEGSVSDSDSVQVTVNNVTADAGSDKTINEGDSVTLTASGGDTYIWNTGATTKSITVSPNTTKTYSVTVQINACEDADKVIVTVNQNNKTVTANAGTDQTICLGDNVTLTASGGSSYSWNTGATTKSITVNPNTTTTYTVTVSEGSVSDADEVIVKVNNITANAGADKTINAGENVTLTANKGDAYLWNTGAKTKSITVSPQKTKNYSVTVYKGSCEDTDHVLVTVNQNDTSPPPAKADAGEDQTICLNKSIKLTARGGATYLWSTGETSKSINVSPTRTTTYTVTATRGGVTNSDSVVVTVENCSALSDETKKEEFNVYPNPSTGTLHIKTNSEEKFNLNIYSINGSVVYTDIIQTMNNSLKTINLTNLNKGIYIVRLFNSNYSQTKKVLIQ